MSASSKIVSALTSIVGAGNVCDSVYNGTSTKYVVFNLVDSRGEVFSDDKPKIDATAMQIHFFCPSTYNYHSDKARIRKALFDAGFTYPQITTIYEEVTKMLHIVFECEISEYSEI